MKIGVAGRFIAWISLMLAVLFTVTTMVTLRLQERSLRSLSDISRQAVDGMFKDQAAASEESDRLKATQVARLLANIAPETIASINLSSLLDFANVAVEDPDISYVSFVSTAGQTLASAGDRKAAAEGALIESDILLQGTKLGKVVLGYNHRRSGAALAAVRKSTDERLAAMGKSEAESLSASSTSLVLIVLLALTAGVVISVLLGRSIKLPLGAIKDFAHRVAEGDLSARAEGRFFAELGEVKAAIEHMVATLQDKIREAEVNSTRAAEETAKANAATHEAEEAKRRAERAQRQGMLDAAAKLADIVERITSASQELARQVKDMDKGTGRQRDRVAETATAMEQMNATILEVARSAGEASNNADRAKTKAVEGAAVVEDSINAIGSVNALANRLKTSMNELGRQAESIGAIMSIISDIADQTNLLALNAAIEAARAGDAGRGFAVVADEVRKLAEKTMDATRQVGESIRAIQDSARTSVTGVDEAARAIESATRLAHASGDTLREIVSLSDGNAAQVQSIAAASEEQSAAAEEIGRAVEKVRTIAAETAESMNRSSRAIDDLARMAGELRDLIGELKGESGRR